MIPEQGQHIAICFRDGRQIDGIVEIWSDNKSSIRSLTGSSIIVIMKTSEDILFYKLTSVKDDVQKIKAKPVKTIEDIKEIASLQTEIKEIEKEEIREKLNQHVPNQIASNFDDILPFDIKVKSTIKHPREKAPRKSSQFGSELSNLFQKRNKDD